jgi:hypothetical protein
VDDPGSFLSLLNQLPLRGLRDVPIPSADFLSCLWCGGRISSEDFLALSIARRSRRVWCPWCERPVGMHETAWNFVRAGAYPLVS